MSHPFVLWVDDEPRQAKNDELLRKVRLEWPRRALRKALHAFAVALAWPRLLLWRCVYHFAHALEYPLRWVASRADAWARGASYVIDPCGFGGEAENYMAQRKYDSLAAWYAEVPPEPRNAMVAEYAARRATPVALQGTTSFEVPYVNAGDGRGPDIHA